MAAVATTTIQTISTQNDLIMEKLGEFYRADENGNVSTCLAKMMSIITGESKISLRIVDWFVTNYAKKHNTTYILDNGERFNVYIQYKLELKAYSKRRFDPFCRWERIPFPYKEDKCIETTIGQLNFFKWTLENKVISYIEEHYKEIESDMNMRNSTSKKKETNSNSLGTKTRKKREELSVSATKTIKKEEVEIVVSFS